jgi:hypothetical protein
VERFRRSNGRYRPWGNLTTALPRRLYNRLAGKEVAQD